MRFIIAPLVSAAILSLAASPLYASCSPMAGDPNVVFCTVCDSGPGDVECCTTMFYRFEQVGGAYCTVFPS